MPPIGGVYANVNPYGTTNLTDVYARNLDIKNGITSDGKNLNSLLDEIITLSQPIETFDSLKAQTDFTDYMNVKPNIQLNTSPLTGPSPPTPGDFIERSVEQSGGCLGILRNYSPPVSGLNGDSTQSPKVLYKKYYQQTQNNDSSFSMFSCGKELISMITASMVNQTISRKISISWVNGTTPKTLALTTTVNDIVDGTDIIGGTYNFTAKSYSPNTVPSEAKEPVYLPVGLGDVTIQSLLQLTAGFTTTGGLLGYFLKQEQSGSPYNPVNNSNYTNREAPFYRNFYLTWALFIGGINSEQTTTVGTSPVITPPLAAPPYNTIQYTDTTIEGLLVPVILNQSTTDYRAEYNVARNLWNFIMYGNVDPTAPGASLILANYNYALYAVLYYYGNFNVYNPTGNYFDENSYKKVFENVRAGILIAGVLPTNTDLENATKALIGTQDSLLYLGPSGTSLSGPFQTVDYRTSCSGFMKYLFKNGNPDISGQNINPSYNLFFNFLYNINFINQNANEDSLWFLFDQNVQVETPYRQITNSSLTIVQAGYLNKEDTPAKVALGNFPVPGFEYNNTSYLFLTKLLQIALLKAVNNSTLSASYISDGYSSIPDSWITNINYYTMLSAINPSTGQIINTGGSHFSGYPVNDPFYNSSYWASLGLSTVDIITHPPFGPDSVVACIRDNFRRYIALNICKPAGIPIGPASRAREYNPIGPISPMDQSFGYYQLGMSLYLQSSKTGSIGPDFSRISLDDFLKLGSAILTDLTIVRESFSTMGVNTPTIIFDPTLLNNILLGSSAAANNCHTYKSYRTPIPGDATDARRVRAEVFYSSYSSSFTDISYFTNTIGASPTTLQNSGPIPPCYLDQSKLTFYWSSGLIVQQSKGYGSPTGFDIPTIITFNGLNGQTCFMDIKTQLVVVRCSAVLSDVPSIISDPSAYYGGSLPKGYTVQGNTGYFNKIVSNPVNARNGALLGLEVPFPYYLSPDDASQIDITLPTSIPSQQRNSFEFGLYVWYVAILPDLFTYASLYNKSFAVIFSFLTYQDLLGFYSYMKDTIAKSIPLDSSYTPIGDPRLRQSPYFESGPITIITGADNIITIESYSSVVPSLANPWKLSATNYFLTEIYEKKIIVLFGKLN